MEFKINYKPFIKVGAYVKVKYMGYTLKGEIVLLKDGIAKVKIPTYYGTKQPIYESYPVDDLVEYK